MTTTTPEPQDPFAGLEPIHSYTRQQAIEDGVLVDVTEWAGPKGIMGGLDLAWAVTREVFEQIEAIPERLEGLADVRGRAHDVLWLATLTLAGVLRRARPGVDASGRWAFRVILPVKGSRKQTQTYHVALCGGDDGRGAATVMLPEQD